MTTVGPLNVRQTIDDDTYGTRLVPLPRDVLPRIAKALAEAGVMDDFAALGRNTSPRTRGWLNDQIARTPIDWDAVLGIDLTPEEAEAVGHAIVDTADEPPTCHGAGGKCTRFAQHPESFYCVPCQAELADPWMRAVTA